MKNLFIHSISVFISEEPAMNKTKLLFLGGSHAHGGIKMTNKLYKYNVYILYTISASGKQNGRMWGMGRWWKK